MAIGRFRYRNVRKRLVARMQKITKLHHGIWHINQFFSDSEWDKVKHAILDIDSAQYSNRQEPMRHRLEINENNKSIPILQNLYTTAAHLAKSISHIVEITNLRFPPGVFLWRDFDGFRSDWHCDDFTINPTVQIYIDGDQTQGTSFRINSKEITLPFIPNTGYLMDNRYQIDHAMLTPVNQHVRKSLYLIY